MKLDQMLVGAFCVGVIAFASGCGSSTSVGSARANAPTAANAAIPNGDVVGRTTELMSAELLGPAPKVGKAHLVLDGVDGVGVEVGASNDGVADEGSPKEARRSDGSHRSGAFGSSK